VRGLDGRPLITSAGKQPLGQAVKAEVAAAVRGGLLTIEEVFERYQMTIEELGTWQYAYQ
jgi:hypothetical protein